jgi:transposase, IS5 family
VSSNAYFCNEKFVLYEIKKNLHKKIMRKTLDYQQTFGKVDISQIKTDPKSRDEIDRTVRGLQYIFTNFEVRAEIFKLLDGIILPKVSKKTGRKGMELWKILVLGVIRQVCS